MKLRRVNLVQRIGKEVGFPSTSAPNHWNSTNDYGQAWVLLQLLDEGGSSILSLSCLPSKNMEEADKLKKKKNKGNFSCHAEVIIQMKKAQERKRKITD